MKLFYCRHGALIALPLIFLTNFSRKCNPNSKCLIITILITLVFNGCSILNQEDSNESIKIEAGIVHNYYPYHPDKSTLTIDIFQPVDSSTPYDTAITSATIVVDSTSYGYSMLPLPGYDIQFPEGLTPDTYLKYKIIMNNSHSLDDSISVHQPILLKPGIGDTLFIDSDYIEVDSFLEDNIERIWVYIQDDFTNYFVGFIYTGIGDSIDVTDMPTITFIHMDYRNSTEITEIEPIQIENTIYRRFNFHLSQKKLIVKKL